MKVIIVGSGRVGCAVAQKLYSDGYEVSVIDKNPVSFERLGENSGISMILGTGIDYDILESAGIHEADAVLSLTNGDNTNIMVAQIAQNIFKVKKVIARIVDLRVKRFYEEEMGLTCYCHTEVSSAHYLGMLKGVDKVCTSL